jgi:hypothetical protein
MAGEQPGKRADSTQRPVRAAVERAVPDIGGLRRRAGLAEAAAALGAPSGGSDGGNGRRVGRAPSREQQHLVLREWEVLRDRLAGIAQGRLADVGDLLTDSRLAFTPDAAESAVLRDYAWAMEAFQAAGKVLDEAADLPDLAACVVLADRALERFAAAHERHAGRRPAAPVVRCFYNPLHGRTEQHHVPGGGSGRKRRGRKTLSAREAAAERRPACASCRLAILADETPDVLPALVSVKTSWHHSAKVFVPYYAVPQQASLWSATCCGAYDDEAPARVLRGEHRRGQGRAR